MREPLISREKRRPHEPPFWYENKMVGCSPPCAHRQPTGTPLTHSRSARRCPLKSASTPAPSPRGALIVVLA
jgi:hypothetical protein